MDKQKAATSGSGTECIEQATEWRGEGKPSLAKAKQRQAQGCEGEARIRCAENSNSVE